MACRKIVADKHRRAVVMMLAGVSQYRALRQAGYSHYSARCPRLVFKHSWPLRQALIEAQEERQHYLRPHPPRRKKYDRRTLALTAVAYCQRDFQEANTAAGIREYDKSARTAQAIAAGKPLPQLKPQDRMTICQRCYRSVREKDRQLNASGTLYVCQNCLYS